MTVVESRPGVRVEPLRLEWAEAGAQGDAVFSDRFGIPVEPGWTGRVLRRCRFARHLGQAAVVLVSGRPAHGFACVDVVEDVAHLW
jgi:hypothetical protein